MRESKKDIDKLLEDMDIAETEKSLAQQYELLFGCPCEVTIHGINCEGEDDRGQKIRIEHSVRLLD